MLYNSVEHTLKLQPKYFDYIAHGTKRIELRLNDAKRQQIQPGDTIRFCRLPNEHPTLTVRVVELLHYPSFADLCADFNIDVLADRTMTKAELLADLSTFYAAADQTRYGVVGIRIELLS